MSNLILKKSSFIHIPKCAGSMAQGILYALNLVKERYKEPQNGHLFLHQMTKSENTFNFCFVRHPYTWWPSFWQWSKRDRFSLMERKCADFDTWVQEYGPFWMGHYSRLISRYIGDDPCYPSKIKMNFIGKSENLYDDMYTALKKAKEDFSDEVYGELIREINFKLYKNDVDWTIAKNAQEYDKKISNESKKIIYKTEKYVFDKFSYES